MTAPALARELPDGRRVYTHPLTGREVPSVTTVINAGIPKPGLVGWSARMAAEYAVMNWEVLSGYPVMERAEEIRAAAERKRDAASDLGTAVHEIVDAWSKGVPHPDPPAGTKGYVNSYISFLMDKRPRFIVNEFTVWSKSHEYAGTGDFIADIGGETWLVDAKSGRKIYGEVALQVSALANADCIISADGTERDIPPVTRLGALHIRPRSWKLTEICHDPHNWQAFLACREIYGWTHEVKPYVFGGTP